ncbi:MAG: class II fructose-bisphosphate aldolase family protein [Bacilli bacterium]|jgi:tagatose 1,6-diphosphate aldolase GatY/KbaY|nr:class II fructose-bisphosphate aldolase family protein [Bacilli bacterium]
MGELVSAQTLLKETRKAKKALVSINVENMETVQALLEAAAESSDPVLVAVSERTLSYATPATFVAMIRAVAAPLEVRYGIHLDHATRLETVESCLRAGFNSIMYDGSSYSYESNVNITERVVEMCQPYGAAVEAKLGYGGDEKGLDGEKESLLGDPALAKDFLSKTGVDSLAVSIGGNHGSHECGPDINFGVMRSIRKEVDVPLVLHGADGLRGEVIRECIRLGISRFNFCTKLRDSFSRAVMERLAEDPDVVDPKKYLRAGREAFKKAAKRIFETIDKKD